ncbi:MAG: hypothetical protein ACR2L1_10295 [Pyrinomonadaceae bacterium]
MTKPKKYKALFHLFIKYGSIWQSVLLITLAYLIWRIYYPGIMSPDSIEQYGQALKNDFVDWHPPLMSLILALTFKVGGGIATLIFFQCLAALFGLRSTVALLLQFFSDMSISKSKSKFIGTIFTVVFLAPFLTPYLFISVIFWKDAWLSIILLWIVSYFTWLFLNIGIFSKRSFIVHLLILSFISTSLVLIRHNIMVTIPVICLLTAFLCGRKLNRVGYALGFVPLILAFSINPVVDYLFNVQHVKAGNLIVATDLTTMVRLFPELEPEYPATIKHRTTPRPNPKDLIIELGNDNEELRNEYLKTFSNHPIKLLAAKSHRFGQMLTYENALKQKLAYDIILNQYGLKTNEDYSEIRYKLNDLSSKTENKWYFIWFSGLHIVWIVINLLALIYFLYRTLIKRDTHSLYTLLLLLIPLSYYSSYLLSATTSDYRFMYPATLLTQVIVLSFGIAGITQFKDRRAVSTKPDI